MNTFTEPAVKYAKSYILKINLEQGDVIVPEVNQDVFFDDTVVILEHYTDSVQIKLKDLGIEFDLDNIQKYIKVLEGEYIEEGADLFEVPSGFGGLSSKKVIAPKSGIVGLKKLSEGIISVNSISKIKKTIKGINGKVKKIVPGKFVEIEADVVSIDGLVRFNPQNGLYNLKYIENLDELTEIKDSDKPNSFEGIGIFYNGLLEMKDLKKLAVLGVESVVTVGMNADKIYADREFFQKYSLELILLEGFGMKELNPKLKQIMSKNDGMLFQSSSDGLFIVNKGPIPLKRVKLYTSLKRGDTVRLYSDEYWGRYGKYYSVDRSSSDYARIKITGEKTTIPVSINNFVKIV